MNKIKKLKTILSELGSVVVAFSGGVDSSFLLKVARDTLPRENVLAVTAVSDTYTRSELKQAKAFARLMGVRHKIIFTDELKDKNFVKNPLNRCYYCKKELFGRLNDIAEKNGFNYVIDASNLDDENDYRPGRRAKEELAVHSPLKEAGLGKLGIRKYSKNLGLATWNNPQMACLASRFPYGQPINKKVLRKIDIIESFIKKFGIHQVRVRCHNNIARIEVEKIDIKKFMNRIFCDKITKRFKELGFKYITLDLEGYRTGSLNEEIEANSKV